MKKKILVGIAVLAIAAVAAWNVNLNAQKSDLSDIALANVEALAEENGSGKRCDTRSYYEFRQELCGTGGKTTSFQIFSYQCITGYSLVCQNGSKVTGMGCNGYVDSNNITTISCH